MPDGLQLYDEVLVLLGNQWAIYNATELDLDHVCPSPPICLDGLLSQGIILVSFMILYRVPEEVVTIILHKDTCTANLYRSVTSCST